MVVMLAFLKILKKKKKKVGCHTWQLQSSTLQVSWLLNFVSRQQAERIESVTCTYDGEQNIHDKYWKEGWNANCYVEPKGY